MAFLSGYTDIAFADVHNLTSTWIALTSTQKDLALSVGRMYIDKNYTCADKADWDTTDLTTIPDEVQLGNSIIAEKYALGELTGQNTTPSKVVSERVKADVVEVETIYAGINSQSTSVGLMSVRYNEVDILLSPYCTMGSNKTLTRV